MSIYLDGVNQEMNYDDGGFGGSVGSNEYPFTLGGTNVGNNSSSYYDGKIDERDLRRAILPCIHVCVTSSILHVQGLFFMRAESSFCIGAAVS